MASWMVTVAPRCALCMAVLGGLAASAHAQTPNDATRGARAGSAEARDHLASAKHAAATGQWIAAAQEYEQANQIEPSPAAAEGVAKARDALHDDVKAYVAFSAMLRDYPQALSPQSPPVRAKAAAGARSANRHFQRQDNRGRSASIARRDRRRRDSIAGAAARNARVSPPSRVKGRLSRGLPRARSGRRSRSCDTDSARSGAAYRPRFGPRAVGSTDFGARRWSRARTRSLARGGRAGLP
jgi:hypothetical protein